MLNSFSSSLIIYLRRWERTRKPMLRQGLKSRKRVPARDGVSFMLLREIMEDIQNYLEQSVLMIWDGFDKPLSQGLLTGQLFGNLRDLFYGKKHRVVTATRATQTELARNKQVEDSPFWNMFDVNPVRVGPLNDSDTEHALTTASLNVNPRRPKGTRQLDRWVIRFFCCQF